MCVLFPTLVLFQLDCCGVAPISPFRNDFQMLGTYFWTNPARGVSQIPYTCCKDSNLDNFRFGVNLQCQVGRQPTLYRPRVSSNFSVISLETAKELFELAYITKTTHRPKYLSIFKDTHIIFTVLYATIQFR